MIVVILKNDAPQLGAVDMELRMRIEGMTVDEAGALGDAIHTFAVQMKRRELMNAFRIDEEMVPH